jgi:hypothetical protein
MWRPTGLALTPALFTCLFLFPASVQVRAGDENRAFPEGTIINNDDTKVQSTVKDLKNSEGKPLNGQVRFTMKRKEGMWGKRLYIYNSNGTKVVTLELGHDQAGKDVLEASIDCRAGDLRGGLTFALEHVGFGGTWHENQRWDFAGESIAGKEIIIEWLKDKG